MKKRIKNKKLVSSKHKLIALISLLCLLIIAYLLLCFYNYKSLGKYNNIILPNTYIEGLDMSNDTYDNASKKINYYQDTILDKRVKFNVNNNIYEYSFNDLGIGIDKEKTLDEIKKYQRSLTYSQRLMMINGNMKKDFNYIYNLDNNKLNELLVNIQNNTYVAPVDGYFDTSDGVRYVKGTYGYNLNVENSSLEVNKLFNQGIDSEKVIDLPGDVITGNNNDSYETIDTLTSTFSTPFMPNTYLRNINLNTALGYINGTVVEPGEVFSYCDKAGPFNKRGYVFYYEFVGNGVCQIATTTYDTALLGGLEIVKRYPHDKKSLYVDGGLDATVASYSSGWCVDMQFKNTYKYPIYIKAYSSGARAYVEFWSNSNAKEGKEYSLSSTQIGPRGYKSYRHVYENGVETNVEEIATTWYIKD